MPKTIFSKSPFKITKKDFYKAKNAVQYNGKYYLRQLDFFKCAYIMRPVQFVK